VVPALSRWARNIGQGYQGRCKRRAFGGLGRPGRSFCFVPLVAALHDVAHATGDRISLDDIFEDCLLDDHVFGECLAIGLIGKRLVPTGLSAGSQAPERKSEGEGEGGVTKTAK
jgi:hypothetical protein